LIDTDSATTMIKKQKMRKRPSEKNITTRCASSWRKGRRSRECRKKQPIKVTTAKKAKWKYLKWEKRKANMKLTNTEKKFQTPCQFKETRLIIQPNRKRTLQFLTSTLTTMEAPARTTIQTN